MARCHSNPVEYVESTDGTNQPTLPSSLPRSAAILAALSALFPQSRQDAGATSTNPPTLPLSPSCNAAILAALSVGSAPQLTARPSSHVTPPSWRPCPAHCQMSARRRSLTPSLPADRPALQRVALRAFTRPNPFPVSQSCPPWIVQYVLDDP